MLTKGIVEKVITPYKVKVRLPIFDAIEGTRNATDTNELSDAIICSLPNISNHVSENDKVIVGFEDEDISKPIILGHLFKEKDNNTLVNLKVGALETTGATKLSKDTYIGDVKPSEIEALSGVESNIQGQINNLYDKLGTSSGGGVSTNDIIIGTYDRTKGTGVLNIRETEDSYPLFKISASTGEQSYVHRTLYTQTLRPETGSVAYDIGSSSKWYEHGYLNHITTSNINNFPFKVCDFTKDGASDYHLVSTKFTGNINRLTFGMLRCYYYQGSEPTFDYEDKTITVPANTRCWIALLSVPDYTTYTFKCDTDCSSPWIGYWSNGGNYNGSSTGVAIPTVEHKFIALVIENNSSKSSVFSNFTLIEGCSSSNRFMSTEVFDGYHRDVLYEGDLQGDLIWENSGTTMSATTWTFTNNTTLFTSLLSYQYMVVEYYGWDGNERHSMKFPIQNGGDYTLYNLTSPNVTGINTRRFTISWDAKHSTSSDCGITTIKIVWQDAQVGNSSATSTKQYACVPYRIYGLR